MADAKKARIWKGMVVVKYKLLSRHFPERTEKNHEKPKSE
jgi:hypothetical protein